MVRPISRVTVSCLIVGLMLALFLGTALRQAAPISAAPMAADKHTLVVAQDVSDAKTMDPGRMYEFTSFRMASNVYEGLVTFHGSDVAHPRAVLATGWKVTKGGKVLTFQLRHGVRFASGNRMTAADVVFSYRRLGFLHDNPAFQMGASKDNNKIYGIQAVGKYAVRFTLPAPDASFLATLSSGNFGVLDSKVVRAHGGDDSPDAATKDKATDYLNGHSAATGPFMMTRWTRGAAGDIVMKRSKYYWGKKPYLNSIILRGISNTTTQRLEVSRGTVDVAAQVDIDGAKALRRNSNTKVITGNTLDLVYMGMTMSPDVNKPLSDARVRRAVRLALDYNGIIKGLLSNVGSQPASMLPIGLLGSSPGFEKSIRPKRNLALARKLMKQAGYGSGFSVNMEYPGGYSFDGVSFDLIAPKVSRDLASIGIQAKLTPEQFSVLLPAYRAQKVALILFVWGSDYPDSNDYAGPFSPGGGPATRMWYLKNSKLEKLVKQGDLTANPKKRAAIYQSIQRTWLKESPWVGVVQPRGIMVLHKGVSGYKYNVVFPGDYRYVRKS